MKQILFLLFLPCLCLAQYTGNANQKITLGEQSTADGLVFRGVLNDTALITPLSDTSAYIILDTVNNKFYNYNRSTNVWSVAGGGTAVTSVATGLGLSGGTITSTGTILVDTASASIISRQRATNTFLTPTGSAANLTSFPTLNQNTTGSAATLTTGRTVQTNLATTSAATFNGSANISPGVTGVLPVANGGTGASTLTANKVMVGNGTNVVITPTRLQWDNTKFRLGIGQNPPTAKLHLSDTFGTNLTTGLQIDGLGSLADNVAPISFFTQSALYGTRHTANIAAGIFDGDYGGAYLRFSTSPTEAEAVLERLRITNLGNVGIGTTSPTFKLDVSGTSRFTDELLVSRPSMTTQANYIYQNIRVNTGFGGGYADARIQSLLAGYDSNIYSVDVGYSYDYPSAAGYSLRFATNDNLSGNPIERLIIASTGNVGIGTASPAVQLHTTSAVRFAGLASITDLRTDASGNLFNGSDFNLKNSIDTINFGLSDVMKLKPVSFNWNNEARNISEYKSMGFIAQDVMTVIPNAASTMGDGDMQVDYNAIVATLTKAIQEQQVLIKALEQRILTLENK